MAREVALLMGSASRASGLLPATPPVMVMGSHQIISQPSALSSSTRSMIAVDSSGCRLPFAFRTCGLFDVVF